MKDHSKTRTPAANIKHRNEAVMTDWIVSADTPAIDCGSMGAQIFIGQKSGVCDAYGARTDGHFVNHLMDVIQERGAMEKINF